VIRNLHEEGFALNVIENKTEEFNVMLTIFETSYWKITHREDSRYPGHLILASKNCSSEISALDTAALTELGSVMAKAEQLLISAYNPYRVITAKLGFSAGYGCHFHMLPVSRELLGEIAMHPDYTNEPDGNDVLLYVSREYCERSLTEDELKKQLETSSHLANAALVMSAR
jgi:diadenosine tetraphosphate (Ap4A) HIT family hydrolase